jgi:hypothetical protein
MFAWPYGQVSNLYLDFVGTIDRSLDRRANVEPEASGSAIAPLMRMHRKTICFQLEHQVLLMNFQSRIDRHAEVITCLQLARISFESNCKGGHFYKVGASSGGNGRLCLSDLLTDQ